MASLQDRPRLRRYLLLTLVNVLTVLVQPARAAAPDQLAGSLKWIPDDAAFYSSLLHNRAQWQAIRESRAWARLAALPAVQTARQKIQAEVKEGGSLAQIYQVYQQPENRQLLDMLCDMVSEEVFLYGGPSWVGFLDLAGQLNAAQSYGPLFMLLSRQGEERNPSKMQATMLLRTLASNLNLIRVPDQLLGFRISDTKRAQDQLKRLELLLAGLEAQVPPLKGRVKKVNVAGGNFLTLTLDGTMVPWEQLSLKDYEQKEGEFDALRKKLVQLQLTVAVGIRDEYLLLSIGESTSLLKTLGGDKRLSERPELKPLAGHASRRIASLSYVSRALRAESQTSQWDAVLKLLDTNLPQLEMSAEQRQRMREDLAEFTKEMKTAAARVGATFAFSFWSERGSEGYSYDYGEHTTVDGSKPLTILNHVGGSPVFALAGRSQRTSQGYGNLVKILQTAYRYFEEFALPKLDADAKEGIERITPAVRRLLKQFDEVTRTMLLPALADGQSALVVDAKLTSPQWFAPMPAAEKPLPILEPAVVLGVSDAALLRKAADRYRSLFNELTTKVHEVVPKFPDSQVPEPESRPVQAGTLYFYSLPAEWGIDRQIVPTAGVSDRVAVLTISQKHAERLLASVPLKVDGGPLVDLKKPRAMAVYVNWVGMVHALTPWVEHGLRAAGVDPAEKVQVGDESWQGVLKQIPTVLEVLQVFRTYSSSTYFEGPVLVTHSETVIKDL